MKAIEDLDAVATALRLRWLNERPRSDGSTEADLVKAARAEYRYHLDAKARLERQARRIAAMIEDCDIAMAEAERFAKFVKGEQ